ncbi:hypothetical protein BOX15_Mlig009050g2, partial [Macrostomum lignano]
IDLVKKKATNLRRVTYLVFDEADKMFQLGFEAQVRSIANHVRPDRQTLLFSATFKRRVERLVRDILTDPIRICQGELGEANQDVRQFVEIFRQPEDKWIWMQRHLAGFCSQGQTLVFVTRKANSEDVAKRISGAGFSCRLLHGDMHQSERNDTIAAYKRGEFQVLVATDVASRGLDIPAIRTVINYESARDIDTHTHRVGRTGRAATRAWLTPCCWTKRRTLPVIWCGISRALDRRLHPASWLWPTSAPGLKTPDSNLAARASGCRLRVGPRAARPGSWRRRRWWWQRRWQRPGAAAQLHPAIIQRASD